jgi:hypothetical protein
MQNHLSQSHEKYVIKKLITINVTIDRFDRMLNSLETNFYKECNLF